MNLRFVLRLKRLRETDRTVHKDLGTVGSTERKCYPRFFIRVGRPTDLAKVPGTNKAMQPITRMSTPRFRRITLRISGIEIELRARAPMPQEHPSREER